MTLKLSISSADWCFFIRYGRKSNYQFIFHQELAPYLDKPPCTHIILTFITVVPDHFRGLGFLHSDLNILFLPENSSQLSGSRDKKCDRGG